MSYFSFSMSQLQWFLFLLVSFFLSAEMTHVYYKKSEIINTKKEINVYPTQRAIVNY